MRLRAHSSGVTMRRSTVAIAGVLALAILAALPMPLKRQNVDRQHPPGPSAAEESGTPEPFPMFESRVWSAPADLPRPRPQIPGGHQAAPKVRDDHLTAPAIRHDQSAISEEARIVTDSLVSLGGISRSGVLTPHSLESKLGVETRVEEAQVSVPVVRSDPQVTIRTPLLTPPVLLFVGLPRYPVEGYRVVVDHSASTTPGVGIDAAEGRVRLKILVRADGSVGGVEVAQSSGKPFLDAAAMGEASRWRFAPATRDGQPIDAWALVPLLFVLR
jgi:TonB family protein